MSVTLLKCLLPLACAAHLALLYCDRIITLLDGGRFDFRLLNDNEKLSAVMGATPTERPLRSMVLGAFAMTAAMPAYLALGAWVLPQSPVCGALMLADGILFLLPGVAHHVFCGAVEWFYLHMNKTEEARAAIVEFFKKTSVTMYVCYFGLLTLRCRSLSLLSRVRRCCRAGCACSTRCRSFCCSCRFTSLARAILRTRSCLRDYSF